MTLRPILAVFLCCFFCISCESEDTTNPNEETPADASLLGVWNYAAYIDDEGEELATQCESSQILHFQTDGVFRFTYYTEDATSCAKTQDATGSWEELSDSSIALDYGIDSYDMNYTISGRVLTLTIDEGLGEYQERYEKQ